MKFVFRETGPGEQHTGTRKGARWEGQVDGKECKAALGTKRAAAANLPQPSAHKRTPTRKPHLEKERKRTRRTGMDARELYEEATPWETPAKEQAKREVGARERTRRHEEARLGSEAEARDTNRKGKVRCEKRTRQEEVVRQEESPSDVYRLVQEGGPFVVSLEELLQHILRSVEQPHRLLCLAQNETGKAVREHFRAFASRIHPDKIPKDGEQHLHAQADEAFKALNNAVAFLERSKVPTALFL